MKITDWEWDPDARRWRLVATGDEMRPADVAAHVVPAVGLPICVALAVLRWWRRRRDGE